jgi:hypothetical protein
MAALSQFIDHLDDREKPSAQVKAYLENELPKLLQDDNALEDKS